MLVHQWVKALMTHVSHHPREKGISHLQQIRQKVMSKMVQNPQKQDIYQPPLGSHESTMAQWHPPWNSL
jgi:hypothetical protein